MPADHAPDAPAIAILQRLLAAPRDDGVSLPRLAKHLGLGASAVLRRLTLMGDAELGSQRGPGWVRVVQLDDRWVAHLTEAGRALAEGLAGSSGAIG